MKLLFVTSRFPYPPIQGDRLRAYHQLRLLARRHQVVLLTAPPEPGGEKPLEAISRLAQIETVATPPWRRVAMLARAPFTRLPAQTLYFFDPGFARQARRLLEQHEFDLVFVQLVRMAPLAAELNGIPKVIDLIDALSLNMARRAQRERGPVAWLYAWEARRVCAYEQTLRRQFDELIVTSRADGDAIGLCDHVHIVPNGVELHPAERGRDPSTIVLTGRMSYFPNADAALWFAERVFPRVRREVPDARFIIVGANPKAAVLRLARRPGVQVTGYVERVQDYLERATVAVAPMQAGTGIQNKVLEAMACGAPVVASPYAVAGIHATDGEHFLIARDEEAFVRRIVCLLSDRAQRQQLALNARRLVKERYTWENSIAALESIFSQAVQVTPSFQRDDLDPLPSSPSHTPRPVN